MADVDLTQRDATAPEPTLASLQARVGELEVLVARLTTVAGRAGGEPLAAEPIDRRRLFRLAGAATVGAVAATAAGALPAAADNGVVINVSTATSSADLVRTDYTGTAGTTGSRFLFQAGTAQTSNVVGTDHAALAGLSSQSGAPTGVLGYSTLADGTGVRGVSTGATGVGLSGTGSTGAIGYSGANGGYGMIALAASGIALKAAGADAALFLDGTGVEPPTGSTRPHQVGEIVVDANGDCWYCTVAGTPGTWRQVSGPSTSGSMHLLASPVRVYDSRAGLAPLAVTKGQISSGEVRQVSCTANGSGVPTDATGILCNLTVTRNLAAGLLGLFPGGTAWPGTSSINYRGGGDLANFAIVACGAGATLNVICQGAATDFVIDVAGYFR